MSDNSSIVTGSTQVFGPPIHRVRLQKLTIYEISEADLNELGRGSPVLVFQSLFVGCFTTAGSFIISLLTSELSDRAYTFFSLVAIVCTLGSIVFGSFWWRARNTLKNIVEEIRARPVFPDGEVLNA